MVTCSDGTAFATEALLAVAFSDERGGIRALPMSNVGRIEQHSRSLATAVATAGNRKVAFFIGAAALIASVLIVPFARVPLPKMPGFIPAYEAALIFVDLLTAVLLLDQYVRLRSLPILVLASAYLFDALIIIPHALSFPGAFTDGGLMGAGPQTTAWLYVFWHGGFPLFVLGYASLRAREAKGKAWAIDVATGTAVLVAVVGVVALVIALTLAATWGHDALPVVMQGSDYTLLVTKGISPAVWVLTLIAMLTLRRKEQRTIDLWLMLVMWIWLFDIGLSAVIGSSRFDLGFYAGRLFGLLAASFLLVTLLVELGRMYARAIGAVANAENRIVELMRANTRADLRQAGKGTDAFVQSQNIAHYRTLLETGGLDETQRGAVLKLLSEEEGKVSPQG